jgi:hypothetical protein
MPKIKTHNANEPTCGPVKIGAPMNTMNTINAMNAMSRTVATSSGNGNRNENALGCAQIAAKRGIHGLSPCCLLCHGSDGLQKVFIDNEPMALCCTVITEIMLRWPSTVRYANVK